MLQLLRIILGMFVAADSAVVAVAVGPENALVAQDLRAPERDAPPSLVVPALQAAVDLQAVAVAVPPPFPVYSLGVGIGCDLSQYPLYINFGPSPSCQTAVWGANSLTR